MKLVTIIAVETEHDDLTALGASMRAAIKQAGAASATVIVFDRPPKRRQRSGVSRIFGKRETGRLFDGIT